MQAELLELDLGMARAVMMRLVVRVAVGLRGVAIAMPLANPGATAIGMSGVALASE
ncbi:MAG: hypothetical protein U1F34_06525 [Gammaproteobacteria bacterium]